MYNINSSSNKENSFSCANISQTNSSSSSLALPKISSISTSNPTTKPQVYITDSRNHLHHLFNTITSPQSTSCASSTASQSTIKKAFTFTSPSQPRPPFHQPIQPPQSQSQSPSTQTLPTATAGLTINLNQSSDLIHCYKSEPRNSSHSNNNNDTHNESTAIIHNLNANYSFNDSSFLTTITTTGPTTSQSNSNNSNNPPHIQLSSDFGVFHQTNNNHFYQRHSTNKPFKKVSIQSQLSQASITAIQPTTTHTSTNCSSSVIPKDSLQPFFRFTQHPITQTQNASSGPIYAQQSHSEKEQLQNQLIQLKQHQQFKDLKAQQEVQSPSQQEKEALQDSDTFQPNQITIQLPNQVQQQQQQQQHHTRKLSELFNESSVCFNSSHDDTRDRRECFDDESFAALAMPAVLPEFQLLTGAAPMTIAQTSQFSSLEPASSTSPMILDDLIYSPEKSCIAPTIPPAYTTTPAALPQLPQNPQTPMNTGEDVVVMRKDDFDRFMQEQKAMQQLLIAHQEKIASIESKMLSSNSLLATSTQSQQHTHQPSNFKRVPSQYNSIRLHTEPDPTSDYTPSTPLTTIKSPTNTLISQQQQLQFPSLQNRKPPAPSVQLTKQPSILPKTTTSSSFRYEESAIMEEQDSASQKLAVKDIIRNNKRSRSILQEISTDQNYPRNILNDQSLARSNSSSCNSNSNSNNNSRTTIHQNTNNSSNSNIIHTNNFPNLSRNNHSSYQNYNQQKNFVSSTEPDFTEPHHKEQEETSFGSLVRASTEFRPVVSQGASAAPTLPQLLPYDENHSSIRILGNTNKFSNSMNSNSNILPQYQGLKSPQHSFQPNIDMKSMRRSSSVTEISNQQSRVPTYSKVAQQFLQSPLANQQMLLTQPSQQQTLQAQKQQQQPQVQPRSPQYSLPPSHPISVTRIAGRSSQTQIRAGSQLRSSQPSFTPVHDHFNNNFHNNNNNNPDQQNCSIF